MQRYWIGQFALSSLWANSSGTVNPWAESAVVLSELSPVHGDSSLCTRHLCFLGIELV